jgi:hypothetical protein
MKGSIIISHEILGRQSDFLIRKSSQESDTMNGIYAICHFVVNYGFVRGI